MDITKMHGLGNDFILVNAGDVKENEFSALAAKLCRRRLSVGADGLIAVCPSDIADAKMRIFNADGSEAQMCGNGIRCFARFVYDEGIVTSPGMSVETLAGIMKPSLSLGADGAVELVTVDMGHPSFDRAAVPMGGQGSSVYSLIELDGQEREIGSVLMGVPHTLVLTDTFDSGIVSKLGPVIENLPLFPEKTNVDFVRIIDDTKIEMRTWERGAGETLACGTGATGMAALLHERGELMSDVEVCLAAGSLFIHIDRDDRCFMSGPAEYVFRGSLL